MIFCHRKSSSLLDTNLTYKCQLFLKIEGGVSRCIFKQLTNYNALHSTVNSITNPKYL